MKYRGLSIEIPPDSALLVIIKLYDEKTLPYYLILFCSGDPQNGVLGYLPLKNRLEEIIPKGTDPAICGGSSFLPPPGDPDGRRVD
jgi:hypothetical protein